MLSLISLPKEEIRKKFLKLSVPLVDLSFHRASNREGHLEQSPHSPKYGLGSKIALALKSLILNLTSDDLLQLIFHIFALYYFRS